MFTVYVEQSSRLPYMNAVAVSRSPCMGPELPSVPLTT
jgi:hypothetical protein